MPTVIINARSHRDMTLHTYTLTHNSTESETVCLVQHYQVVRSTVTYNTPTHTFTQHSSASHHIPLLHYASKL